MVGGNLRRCARKPEDAHRDFLRGCICVLLFTHFFVPAIEPPTRESLLDPPGGICHGPLPLWACAWSYGMTWLVSHTLCVAPWLSVHNPQCRIVTACAVCVPVFWCINALTSIGLGLAIYWSPVSLLFCGKRPAQECAIPTDAPGSTNRRRKPLRNRNL